LEKYSKRKRFRKEKISNHFGRDGTFLSTSHFIKNQKIIGVNQDKNKSEGALTSISLENLKRKLKKNQRRKFSYKKIYQNKCKNFSKK